jgi:hypothetical protein
MRDLTLASVIFASVLGCGASNTVPVDEAKTTLPAPHRTMKAFWNDSGRGLQSSDAREVDLVEARLIWSDDVRGVKDNFFGLIDDEDRCVQFYFEDSIPDDIEDPAHLRIILMDFPVPSMKGSYSKPVTIGEVHELIRKAFESGADHRNFEGVSFTSW